MFSRETFAAGKESNTQCLCTDIILPEREKQAGQDQLCALHISLCCAIPNISHNFFQGLLGLQSSFRAEMAAQ